MDKRRRTILAVLAAVVMAAGATIAGLGPAMASELAESAADAQTSPIKAADVYAATDYAIDWKSSANKTIALNGSSAEVKGAGVAVSGSTVSITASGIYVISGKLTDGSITVDVDKKKDTGVIYLVLNNAQIASKTSAPIWIHEGKKVVILLADGTANTVTGGEAVVLNADEEPSATIYSKADLTITGNGKLTVDAGFNDAITSKDDLKITSGSITIDAASDGLVGKDSVSIAGGTFTINAGKDGIRATNDEDEGKGNVIIHGGTFTIKAGGDGIQAYSLLQIEGGSFSITTGGGYPGKSTNSGNEGFGPKMPTAAAATATADESMKGIKAERKLVVNGGNVGISSYDDSIHSNYDIEINGGTIEAKTGDDGAHAENSLTVNGGDLRIDDSYEGLEGAIITINKGNTYVNSTDDGFNVNANGGKLIINGGSIKIIAGGDGLDSNGSIVMTGGTAYVDGPTVNNNGSVDYEGSFTISGGTLVASGSSGMAQAPGSTSTQPSVLMYYTSTQAQGTAIVLKDASGNKVAEFTPSKQYSSVAISSPLLKVGSTYTLYSGAKELVKFTLSSMTTYMSETGAIAQPMGPGGKPGGQMIPPGGMIKRP